MNLIRFSKPHNTGNEISYISDAIARGHLSGDGKYTDMCQEWIRSKFGASKVLLTHSCTAALEMSALLLDIQSGDEVIMPSYTFVSTANAFVLRGGTPVFVDIDPFNLNINCKEVENAITEKTKAIVVVHYAGASCNMTEMVRLANKYSLYLIEDAAQAFLSKFNNQYLGTFGHLATFSFHETKNISSGEGGALIINKNASHLIAKAEIVREKGTNRSLFFRGEVDKYSWVDIGSSYLPNELTAAFLYAQLEASEEITKNRLAIWNKYFNGLKILASNKLKLPKISKHSEHNGHIFYILADSIKERSLLIQMLKEEKNIQCTFHYVPLHLSSFGKSKCKTYGTLHHTESISERIIRIPLWNDISPLQDYIIDSLKECINKINC